VQFARRLAAAFDGEAAAAALLRLVLAVVAIAAGRNAIGQEHGPVLCPARESG
jgi:hypothetical protein